MYDERCSVILFIKWYNAFEYAERKKQYCEWFERRGGEIGWEKLMMPKTNVTAKAAVAAKRPIFLQNPRLKPTKLCYLMRTEPSAKENTKRDYTRTTLWQLQLNKLVDRKILYDLMMNACLSCKKRESHLTVNSNLLWYEHMCTFRNYIGIHRWRRNVNEYIHHNKNRSQVSVWANEWVSEWFFPFRSDFTWTIPHSENVWVRTIYIHNAKSNEQITWYLHNFLH